MIHIDLAFGQPHRKKRSKKSVSSCQQSIEATVSDHQSRLAAKDVVEKVFELREGQLVFTLEANDREVAEAGKRIRALRALQSMIFDLKEPEELASSLDMDVHELLEGLKSEWSSLALLSARALAKEGYTVEEVENYVFDFFDLELSLSLRDQRLQKTSFWKELSHSLGEGQLSERERLRVERMRDALFRRTSLEVSVDILNREFSDLEPITMHDFYELMDEIMLDWVKKHHGEIPRKSEMGSMNKPGAKFQISYNRFYRRKDEEGRELKKAEILIGLMRKANQREIAFHALVNRKSEYAEIDLPDDFEELVKTNVLISLVRYVERTQISELKPSNLGTGEGQFPLRRQSLVKQASDSLKGKGWEVFDSWAHVPLELREAIDRYAFDPENTSFRLIEIDTTTISPIPDELVLRYRAYWQKEALEELYQWIKNNPNELKISKEALADKDKGGISVSYERLTGKTSGRVSPRIVIFPNGRKEMIKALREYFQEKGEAPPSIFLFYFTEIDEEIAEWRQQDIVRHFVDFIVENARYPEADDFTTPALPFERGLVYYERLNQPVFTKDKFFAELVQALTMDPRWESELSSAERQRLMEKIESIKSIDS